MRKTMKIVSSLLCMLTLTVGSVLAQSNDVLLTGQVTDRLTGAPIEYVDLHIQGEDGAGYHFSWTDTNGFYQINIPNGSGKLFTIQALRRGQYYPAFKDAFMLTAPSQVVDLDMRAGYYDVIDLGPEFPGNNRYSINNNGEVIVHNSEAYPSNVDHLYLWDGSSWQELATTHDVRGGGYELNDLAQTLGYINFSGEYHGALVDELGATDLGALPPMGSGSPYSIARTLNNHMQVAGMSRQSYDDEPFTWQNGIMNALGLRTVIPNYYGLFAYVHAMNNRGEILGSYEDYDATSEVFYVWSRGEFDMRGQGPWHWDAWVADINEAGQAPGTMPVGEAQYPNGYLPIVWEESGITTLPTLVPNQTNGYYAPFKINNSGDVLEYDYIWRNGSELMDINEALTSESSIFHPSLQDMNDHGEIVGHDYNDNIIILTPVYVGNQPPLAAYEILSVAKNGSLPITLVATDDDNDPLTYIIKDQPKHGSLSGTPPNVTYTPDADYAGPDSFTFRANDGIEDGRAAVVSIAVTGNQAPYVQAGQDATAVITTWSDGNAFLAANAGDDDPLSSLGVTWSKISGPGPVTFTNANTLITRAIFMVEGVYELQIEVDDGEFTATDSLMVTVAENQGPYNVDAGPDQTITLPATAQLAASAEDDGLPYGDLYYYWYKFSGPGAVTFSGPYPYATTTASFDQPGVYEIYVSVDDGDIWVEDTVTITVNPDPNQAPNVDAGVDQSITLPSDTVNLDGTVTDDGMPSNVLFSTWSKVSGPGAVTFGDPNAEDTTATFSSDGTYVLQLLGDDSVYQTIDTVTITVNPIPNQAPNVDAGSDQTITLPSTASLDGTVTDDGLPSPAITTLWTKVSGPGSVTFGNPTLEDTTASFSMDGTYVLQLLADDGELQANDTVTITVNPIPNQAPSVDAGASQTITLPSAANLDGTVTDDGLPGPYSATWSKVSGPGSVTFGDANAEDTTASFSTDGTYVLQLLADDGELQASDTVTITVNAIPNQAPSVDAGSDFSTKWKKNFYYALDGTVTDDGLPNPPGATSVTWSKVSGPGNVTFSNANTVDTSAKFSKRGTYVLKLTADDGSLTADDTITVTLTRR